MYKDKYLKYKKKYLDLLKLYGGEFRTNIDNCEKINNFIQEFIGIIESEHNESNNKTNKINKINELYLKYYNLFETNENNKTILANFNYLLGIKLAEITNNDIKQIITSSYEKKNYNENPIKLELDNNGFLDVKCLQDIQVWYKPYILEDFWRCNIEEFMDEYDKFENTNNLQSYLLFWTSIINMSSLLCRIKTCNYYFIKVNNNTQIPTQETYSQMILNKEIVQMTNTNTINAYTENEILKNYPQTKLIFTYFYDISDEDFNELSFLLAKCLNCEYDNMLTFYLKFICLMNEKEIHNNRYSSGGFVDLVNIIKKICGNTNNNLKEYNLLIYISLNLPKDSTYARNEYTNMICTSINSLQLIDTIPISMGQIVGHDYYFHRAEPKKLSYSIETKEEFRNLVKFLESLNNDKDYNFKKINSNINKVKSSFKYISEDYVNYRINFLNKYLTQYENYDCLNFLDIVHYIFHEQNTFNKCFSKNLFIEGIDKNLNIQLYSNVQSEYLLNIIAFLLFNDVDFNKYFRVCPNFFQIMTNIFNIIITKEYIQEKKLKNDDFANQYLLQLIETNKCLIGGKNIINPVGL